MTSDQTVSSTMTYDTVARCSEVASGESVAAMPA